MLLRDDDGPYSRIMDTLLIHRVLFDFEFIEESIQLSQKQRKRGTKVDVNVLPRCEQDLRTKIT